MHPRPFSVCQTTFNLAALGECRVQISNHWFPPPMCKRRQKAGSHTLLKERRRHDYFLGFGSKWHQLNMWASNRINLRGSHYMCERTCKGCAVASVGDVHHYATCARSYAQCFEETLPGVSQAEVVSKIFPGVLWIPSVIHLSVFCWPKSINLFSIFPLLLEFVT